jgi:hypothetical protein
MANLFPSEFLAARLQLRIPLRGPHGRQLNCSPAQQAVQFTLHLLSTYHSLKQLKAVLRIHEILVRIRISGSINLTGCGSGSSIFVSDLQDIEKVIFFPRIFFAYYLLKVHLHHFPKIKSHKEVTKQ